MAERLGRTLGELDATMGAWEYRLWMAKDEIDNMVQARVSKVNGLSHSDALDQVRSEFHYHRLRKAQ